MLRKTVLAVTVAFASFACGGDGASPSSPAAPDSAGSLNVRITDSPFGAAKSVLITFSEVAVQRGGDWTRLPFPDGSTGTWMCDLKKLEGNATDLLASGAPSGSDYSVVRLVVQSARIYVANAAQSATPCARTIADPGGESYAATLGNSTGSDNGSFPIRSNAPTTILVDFDGEASLTENGTNNFILTPVVRLVSVQ